MCTNRRTIGSVGPLESSLSVLAASVRHCAERDDKELALREGFCCDPSAQSGNKAPSAHLSSITFLPVQITFSRSGNLKATAGVSAIKFVCTQCWSGVCLYCQRSSMSLFALLKMMKQAGPERVGLLKVYDTKCFHRTLIANSLLGSYRI